MRRFTDRHQQVTVFTLSALRKFVQGIGGAEGKFSLDKLHHDHLTVCGVDLVSGKKSYVVLPTYPTGHEDDARWNPNVVLDPIGFVNANTPAERSLFVPLLGSEVLDFYERLHQGAEFSLTRCC